MAYLDYDGLSTVRNLIDQIYLRESDLSYRLDPIDGTVSINRLAAADETTASVLSAFDTYANVCTPDEMGVFHPGAGFIEMAYAIAGRLYLAWMNNDVLEIGLVRISVDVQTLAVTYSALGHTSMAYGVAEVDAGWTIEALPDDTTYELPPATASTLGGVKVGNGLSVTSDGTLSPNLNYAASPTSGGNAIKSNGILYGAVDSTSTSTVFTATVDGLTALYDGACVMLRNGVVTSASGWTLNVNGLGAKPVYSNMGATTRETTLFNTNYTMLFVYDSDRIEGGCWMLYRGYYSDANSIGYQLRTNSSTLPAQAKFYRYRLLFTSADGTHWVPANTSTSTSADTAKTPNSTTPIDPLGPISYYGTTSAVNANANVGSGYQWQQYAINLGYSFNATSAALTLDYPKPVYVKCHPLADGSATIDATTPYTQALPSTADGCIYIYLGRAYSATNIELVPHHPVYWHDGTGIRLWTGAESIVANGSITTAKLANGAVTNAKLDTLSVGQENIKQNAVGYDQLADDAVGTDNMRYGAVTIEKISGNAKQELVSDILYATDATTAQTLAALGFTATVLTPQGAYSTVDAYGTSIQMSTRSMLCWIDTSSGYLEKAPLGFSGNMQSQTIMLWAKGLHSMATGTIGVDNSWTITALPTDADGVSY